jgi:hypothetical protein
MVKYQEAKIYCIRSYQTEQIYVGSTCEPLARRLATHKSNFRKYQNNKYSYVTVNEILKYGDAYIELIEKFPCEDKEELNKREGHYIRTLDCVNKVVPGRTIKESQKAYCQSEKGRKKKRYHTKKYYWKYKEIINQKQSTNFNCICGGRYTKANKSRHVKTIFHRLFLLSLHNELNHLEL